VSDVTEITIVGGQRLRVTGAADAIELMILSAARGSIMELAWMTEADTGDRIGINPEHVMMLRALSP
jgi:hypothetical protein